jgi:hypothetical protein
MHGPDDHLERAPDTAEPVHPFLRGHEHAGNGFESERLADPPAAPQYALGDPLPGCELRRRTGRCVHPLEGHSSGPGGPDRLVADRYRGRGAVSAQTCSDRQGGRGVRCRTHDDPDARDDRLSAGGTAAPPAGDRGRCPADRAVTTRDHASSAGRRAAGQGPVRRRRPCPSACDGTDLDSQSGATPRPHARTELPERTCTVRHRSRRSDPVVRGGLGPGRVRSRRPRCEHQASSGTGYGAAQPVRCLHHRYGNFGDKSDVLVFVAAAGLLGLVLLFPTAGEFGKRVEVAHEKGRTATSGQS